jgi:putative phosphoribosyl transferase
MPPDVTFADRREAGRQLAAVLIRYKDERPIVLALPRGGVPVAYEVARRLAAPLDVVLVRKIGAPGQPELGIGAVMDGAQPQVVINEEIYSEVAPPPGFVEAQAATSLREIERRRQTYRGGRPMLDIAGRTVIVVDDGIATGGTVRAVLRGLGRSRPARRVLAVPVAPRDAIASLSSDADEIVCLVQPDRFFAVGDHYADFRQTSDREVIELLRQSATFASARSPT